MSRSEDMKKQLLELNLEYCQSSTEANDSLIYTLLMHGFKGFNNMTIDELINELKLWGEL
jgi:hypothetical protein